MRQPSKRTASWLRAGLLLSVAAAVPAVVPAHAADAPAPAAAAPDDLAARFRNPPAEARPRVWWHWINGNVTADGIVKDLEWMQRVGIGGAQTFDVNLASPQIVDQRLVYMTPAWKEAFRTAAATADRLGLELTIASSPGWSETGAPWVAPEDGMKKLVWSEASIAGGRKVSLRLPAPPSVTGPYQSLAAETGTNSSVNNKSPDLPAPFYRDAVVLALPMAPAKPAPRPSVSDMDGAPLDGTALLDGDLQTWLAVPKAKSGPTTLQLAYDKPRPVRSATILLKTGGGKFLGTGFTSRLEAEGPGGGWQPVADLPLGRVPTTVDFAPVTARRFRVVFSDHSTIPQVGPFPPGVDLLSLASGFGGSRQRKEIPVAQLELHAEPRIDQAEAKAGFAVVPDYYALTQRPEDGSGIRPGAVIDVTRFLRPDGTLEWQAPKGSWRILRLGYSLIGTMNHPAPLEATGLEVDKYDAAAVRRYMEHYVGLYRDAVGPGMIGSRGVRAVLNDSIEVGAANWTGDMVGQFRRLRGYDPTPWLPALTGTVIGTRAESDRFLFDFRRTLSDLLAEAHYGTVAKVAHENGLKVYGEALEDGRPQLGDDMAMRSHADVPMGAMWHFSGTASPKPSYLADLKGASSVAHVYGRSFAAAESLTSMLSPWAFGPRSLKRAIDLEFALGINRPVIHTSVHVPVDDRKPGLRLGIFGQDFNRNEAWGELARPWMDYIARNALMLQQGSNVADVAYFYGEDAPITGLFNDTPVQGIPKETAFDFVNAEVLTDAMRVEDGHLVTTGGARYRVLYLGGSSRQMSLRVLQRLARLVEDGATVVGMRPQGDPGLSADQPGYDALLARLWPGSASARVGKGTVIASADLGAALRTTGVAPDFAYTGTSADSALPFVHRRLADGDAYFISNQKDRAETVEARFRVTGKAPELWHAETGNFEPVSYAIRDGVTVVPMTLRPEESVHVVFRRPAAADSLTVPAKATQTLASLDGPWAVAFEAGRGAPASTVLPTLAPLDESTDAGIRYFSGIATYSRNFKAPRGWKPGQPLQLDLGEAYEVAEVRVNGQTAGYAWHAPYVVDIAALMQPGTNRLEVRVGNLWVNRLAGDAQPAAAPVTWTATKTYRKDAPLRRSGLIGPVRLTGSR